MSMTAHTAKSIVGEPEVVEDAADASRHPAWLRLKEAATALQELQVQDGSIPQADDHADARACVETIVESIRELAPLFPHDAEYLTASMHDFQRWADGCKSMEPPARLLGQ